MKKKGKTTKKTEEIAEDWCFVCKDGGLLIVCDHKNCLKSYHTECVGKNESALETEDSWTCEWHSCFICHKSSRIQCFCCPNAVCQRCFTAAEFVRLRGCKGFCNNCLKLALLSEENLDFDSDGEKVDFKDRETYEGLFMEYWDIIKEKEDLTVEDLHSADVEMKKGKNYKYNSHKKKSHDDEEIHLSSDLDAEDDDTESDKPGEIEVDKPGEIEGDKPVQIKKRSKGQRMKMDSAVESYKREFIGWGSKSLMDFLSSIGKDTCKELSQYDVSCIITEYINKNRLFDPECKRKVLCDERLRSVLGRKTVNRHKIYDILESHFIENLEVSEEDEQGYSSEDKDGNLPVAIKKQKSLSTGRKTQEKEVFDAPQSCYAAIIPENMKLVYLRRGLVQELLKQPETFECKLIGSFVRVKSKSSEDSLSSHQLAQVTGMKTSSGENNTEILLQVSMMSEDICINMLSDDNFSEEECEDLKQKVKRGLLRKPTVVALEQKARNLHEDITKHWICRELVLLQNRIDRANEKGWRREFFECSERKQMLQTQSEQLRLIERVPKVTADVADIEPIFNDAIKDYKQGDERSPKSILVGSSDTPADNGRVSGTSSGDLDLGSSFENAKEREISRH